MPHVGIERGAMPSSHEDSSVAPTSTTDTRPWWCEMTGYHWWVLTVAILGWLFDGMDQRIFVLARTPALTELLPRSSSEEVAVYAGYATSIFILGWATGGLIFGVLGDRWGRVRTMTVTILMYSMFTGLSSLSQTWWDFSFYRFLCGMGIGGEYAAGVALIAEVVPSRARPYALGSLQAMGAIGHIAASALSLFVGPQTDIGPLAGWRVLFLIGIIPSLLVVVIRLRLREPESWLRAQEQAKLSAVGAAPSASPERPKELGDLREILRDRRWRYHTIVGMMLGMVGQIGNWGIAYWIPELVRSALSEERSPAFQREIRSQDGKANRSDGRSLDGLTDVPERNQDPIKVPSVGDKREQDRYVAHGTMLKDVTGMVGIYAAAWLAVRAGRRRTFAMAFLLTWGSALFTFGNLAKPSDVYWMIPLYGFCNGLIWGGYALYFSELYPTRLRSTGIGLCYNVARYITSLGPLALGQLTALFGQLGHAVPLRPAAMSLATIYLLGLCVVPFAPETKGKPLPE